METVMGEMSIKKNSSHILIKIKEYFRIIVDSISGKEHDYTKGSMKLAIVLLSIPMALEMLMESVFAIADIFFVSKISPEAVAVVGITESVSMIVYSIAIGLAQAATAMVSRRIGEKDSKGAATAAFQAIIAGTIPALLIAVPGVIYAEEILMLMGIEQAAAAEYSGYTSLLLGSNIVIMLLFIINGIFRSAGNAAISMKVLWFSNILNIILDPIFIFGWGPIPAMGITGAALATTIGRGLAVIYQLSILFRGNSRIKLSAESFKVVPAAIKKLFKLSLGTIGQYVIATASWIVLVRIVAEFGSDVVAGYTIALRIMMFCILPIFGISNAASTLVGQNLGAKQPERAEKSAWITSKITLLAGVLIAFVMVIFGDNLMALFIDNAIVIAAGADCLKIMGYGFPAYSLGMVFISALNGAGDTVTPSKIMFFSYWLVGIPLAYLLSIMLEVNEYGVYYTIIISETLLTVIAGYLFKKGKWKLSVV